MYKKNVQTGCAGLYNLYKVHKLYGKMLWYFSGAR